MTPCYGLGLLFDDPDRVTEARNICKRTCPLLIECRAWALKTDVAGVCGGLTEEERDHWRAHFGVTVATEPVTPTPHKAVKQRRQRVIEMLEQGVARDVIARELDISVDLVNKDVERMGHTNGERKITLNDQEIVTLVSSGLPRAWVARQFGIHPKTVYRVMRRSKQAA